MTHQREQQKSKLIRHGQGKYHEKAQRRMADMLEKKGWDVYTDEPLSVRHEFLSKPLTEYYHEYDLYATKKHIITALTSEIIVEIDGKKHNSSQQKARDIRAANYAAFFIPDARFIRMPIDLLLNQSISDDTILKEYKLM